MLSVNKTILLSLENLFRKIQDKFSLIIKHFNINIKISPLSILIYMAACLSRYPFSLKITQ